MSRHFQGGSDRIYRNDISTARFEDSLEWFLACIFRFDVDSRHSLLAKWGGGSSNHFLLRIDNGTNNAPIQVYCGGGLEIEADIMDIDKWYAIGVGHDGTGAIGSLKLYVYEYDGDTLVADGLTNSASWSEPSSLTAQLQISQTASNWRVRGEVEQHVYVNGNKTRDQFLGYAMNPEESIATWRRESGLSWYLPMQALGGTSGNEEPDYSGNQNTFTRDSGVPRGDNAPYALFEAFEDFVYYEGEAGPPPVGASLYYAGGNPMQRLTRGVGWVQ